MNRDFVLNHFLPALFVLVIGVAVSGGTLSYYRGQNLDMALLGVVLYVMCFLIGSFVLSAAAWGVGYATVGNLGRAQFQIVWVVTAAIVQVLIAAMTTYDLHQLGVFSVSDFARTRLPVAILLVSPYLATFHSLSVFFKTDESDADRTLRLASLESATTDYNHEASKSRPSAFLPIAICTLLIFSVVWYTFGMEREAVAIAASLGVVGGLMFGIFVHSTRPAQRRLRNLKSAVDALKK